MILHYFNKSKNITQNFYVFTRCTFYDLRFLPIRFFLLLGGHILKTVDEEKDLGVMIWKDLKASRQCVKIVKAANLILGMIKNVHL